MDKVKFLLIASLTLCVVFCNNAQTTRKDTGKHVVTTKKLNKQVAVEDTTVYTIVDKMPEFPKDNSGDVNAFLRNHLYYPYGPSVHECGFPGRVIVQFVVTETGKITRIKVVRGVDPSLDKEAVRVIRLFPDWIPGELKGKKVKVRYTLPVSFKLQ